MKFVLYGYAVSFMPGGAWFANKLARLGKKKNECSRNFKPRAYKINRKRDTAKYYRTVGEIINFSRQALL